jgi:hypothetical protein
VPILFGLIVLVGLFGNALVSAFMQCSQYARISLTDTLNTIYYYYIIHVYRHKISCTCSFNLS